jgi:hypothetical protein
MNTLRALLNAAWGSPSPSTYVTVIGLSAIGQFYLHGSLLQVII